MERPKTRAAWIKAGLGAAPDADIGRKYQLSRERVRQIRVTLKVPLTDKAKSSGRQAAGRATRVLQDARRAELRHKYGKQVRALISRGDNALRISKKLGLTWHLVRRIAADEGLAVPKGPGGPKK